MSYETTDYRQRHGAAPRTGQPTVPGDRRYPMDVPAGGRSAKGLLIAVVALVAFIAFIALMSIGGDPGTAPAGLQEDAPHTLPNDGTTGTTEVSPTPAVPSEPAPVAPAQGE